MRGSTGSTAPSTGARAAVEALLLWLVLLVPGARQVALLGHDQDHGAAHLLAGAVALACLVGLLSPASGLLVLAVAEAVILQRLPFQAVAAIVGVQVAVAVVVGTLSRAYRPGPSWPPRRLAILAAAPSAAAAACLATRPGLPLPVLLAGSGLGVLLLAHFLPGPLRALASLLGPVALAGDRALAWIAGLLTTLAVRPAVAPSPGPEPWRQVGDEPPPARRWPLLTVWVLVTAASVSGTGLGFDHLAAMAAVAVAALLLTAASDRRWPVGAALVVAAAAIDLVALRGPAKLVLELILALTWPIALGLGRLRRERSWWDAGPVWPAVAAFGLATARLSLRADHRSVDADGLTIALVLLGLVLALPPVHNLTRKLAAVTAGVRTAATGRIGRVAAGIGRLAGALAMVPVALLLSLNWCFHRFLQVDVLRPPVQGRTRWVVRRGGDSSPTRTFAVVPVPAATGASLVLRRLTAGLGTIAVLAGGAVLLRPTPPTVEVRSLTPTVPERRNFSNVRDETDYFSGHIRWNPQTAHTTADFEGRYVHVKDGVRKTWRAPACSCRRLQLWLFGGSSAFGFYQRDLHSFPSQLAQLAWKDGIALDIVTYASPGMVIGQEVQRFANLSVREPAPDVVITYDGANEIQQQLERNMRDQGDDPTSVDSFERQLDTVLRTFRYPDPVTKGDSARTDPYRRVPDNTWVDIAMTRYGQDLTLFRRVAASIDTPLLAFWQPQSPLAPEGTSKERAVLKADERARWRAILLRALTKLPAGVIDLSDSFDDVTRRTWEDKVHTDEYGAGVTARATYDHLLPLLVEALDEA